VTFSDPQISTESKDFMQNDIKILLNQI
jgi:hypothetical protein